MLRRHGAKLRDLMKLNDEKFIETLLRLDGYTPILENDSLLCKIFAQEEENHSAEVFYIVNNHNFALVCKRHFPYFERYLWKIYE